MLPPPHSNTGQASANMHIDTPASALFTSCVLRNMCFQASVQPPPLPPQARNVPHVPHHHFYHCGELHHHTGRRATSTSQCGLMAPQNARNTVIQKYSKSIIIVTLRYKGIYYMKTTHKNSYLSSENYLYMLDSSLGEKITLLSY